MAKNYYDILGVARDATLEEISRAYRALAKEYHPDGIGGDDRKFSAISEAYATLKSETKRAAYDLTLQPDEVEPEPIQQAPTGPGRARAVWDDDGKQSSPSPSARPQWASATGNYGSAWRSKVLPVGIAALVLWAGYVILTHFTGFGGSNTPPVPSVTPYIVQGSGGSGSVPSVTPAATPTPSTAPGAGCPTGVPNIAITQQPQPDGFGGYTVSGTLTNNTSATIDINSVGFYLGTYDPTKAPDWTVAWSSTAEQQGTIAPGETIQWTTNDNVSSGSGNTVAVTLSYPSSDGGGAVPRWFYTGDVDSSCQPSQSASS